MELPSAEKPSETESLRVLFLETDLGLRDLVGTALAAGSPEILTARSPEEVVRKPSPASASTSS